ncbi:MAG: TIM44-like domain-containing protein [Xanthobacteraceae bacterium]
MLRSGKRSLIAVLAVAAALLLSIADHADARVGGRSSFGSRGFRTFTAPPVTRTAPRATSPIERSTTTQPGGITRPGAAPSGAGGMFNRPGLFGGGLLGGLAAGFLGAGLFGLLFGHGLFGGLGGMASMFGLLLQIGLIALLGMWLYRMWQGRRQQPAFAGGPQVRDIGLKRSGLNGSGLDGSGVGGSLGTGAGPRTAPSDEVGIQPEDYQTFERLLGEIQTAYSNEDLNALRARATPEMVSYFAEDLAQNASRGVVNKVSEVKLEQGDLAEAWREGDTEYASVAMRFSLIDRVIDRASGRLVDGSDERDMATEVWTFRRARGGQWMLSAIQQAG